MLNAASVMTAQLMPKTLLPLDTYCTKEVSSGVFFTDTIYE
jgi:hypothetical protein